MTDFVTRLEDELRDAALRRERAGRVRGAVLPRVRLALGDVPAAAVATVLVGLALAGTALIISSSPDRVVEPGIPAQLRGEWRAGPTELRLYPAGARRCANLGLDASQPCYTIGSAATRVAEEWGEVSTSGNRLTLSAVAGGPPGVYRWKAGDGKLRLSTIRDPNATRSAPLTSEPFSPAQVSRAETLVPPGWTAKTFSSTQYGVSIRFPAEWSARAAHVDGAPDRLSRDPGGSSLPSLAIAAQPLADGATAADWNRIVDSRSEAAGCARYDAHVVETEVGTVNVTSFANCGGISVQRASFTHGREGWSIVWRGRPGRATVDADAPRFDALLRTLASQ
jgi:hypothetical protein